MLNATLVRYRSKCGDSAVRAVGNGAETGRKKAGKRP
jgi:hypothetical protein